MVTNTTQTLSDNRLIGELERVIDKEKPKENIVPDEEIVFTLPKIPTFLNNDNFEVKKQTTEQENKERDDGINIQKIQDEIDSGNIPSEYEFYFGCPNRNFFLKLSTLNLSSDNSDFIDFLSSDVGSQILRKNQFSIHIETGNIVFDNCNKGESIYDFLLTQQDDTKKIIHATLPHTDSFSNYIKYFLGDIDADTVDKFDFFTNKNVKYLFYRFNNYLLFRSQPTVPVRHSKISENKIVLEEVQNRDWQYLVESAIRLAENDKRQFKPLPRNENKIMKSMKHNYEAARRI